MKNQTQWSGKVVLQFVNCDTLDTDKLYNEKKSNIDIHLRATNFKVSYIKENLIEGSLFVHNL